MLPWTVRASLFAAFLGSIAISLPRGSTPAQFASGKHEVLVEAPEKLYPGGRSGLRCAVFHSQGVGRLEPVAGAAVEVVLVGRDRRDAVLFKGQTAKGGTLDARFPVPEVEEGDYTLEVRTRSSEGSHVARKSVRVQRAFRILLVTDKPLYQPSQTVHIRALTLGEMSLTPAARRDVLFEVEDSKTNKVFKRTVPANEFGVASADFRLADEVNMGTYRVRAVVGKSRAEKTVTVKKYVLPKFKIAVKTEKNFYLPGETVKGSLEVRYFFGKPVKEGDVRIKASTFDVRFREFLQRKTKTDGNGRATFEVKLPDYFVGHPLEKGDAFVQFEISVVDTAEHEEKVTKRVSVSNSLLHVYAVPESGKLVPGVENIVYVLAGAPDGSPRKAEVRLEVPGKTVLTGETNETGFAALRLKPEASWVQGDGQVEVRLSAKDASGNRAERKTKLSTEYGKDQVLLRLDKAIYEAGSTAEIDLLATFPSGMAFVDVVREGQTVLTATCELSAGRARYSLPLTPELFGSMEVHAYKMMGDGQIVRDSRVIYVHPSQDLRIQVRPDKAQYAPAEQAKIRFQVTDKDGKPVQAALGVIVVDESVYALQDMQPGLEKVYFTLQEELLKPRYQIKIGTTIEQVVNTQTAAVKQDIAKILMAPAAPPAPRWSENTYAQRLRLLRTAASHIFTAMYYHIVSNKGGFYQVNATTGKREFKSDLLRDLTQAKTYKLPKNYLIDPWGNKVTLEDLARLSKKFTFEYWAKLMSLQNLQQIWTHLTRFVAENDAVAWDGRTYTLKGDLLDRLVKAGLPAAAREDYFGEAFTVERLSKEDDAFDAANVAKMTAEIRKVRIFAFLRDYVAKAGGLKRDGGAWIFEAGVGEALGKAPFSRRAEGRPWTLEDLAKEDAAFSAANLARIANVDRRKHLYDALTALIRKAGFDRVAVFEKEWRWKPGMMDLLVREKYLTEAQAGDVGGRRFDLAEVVKADAQFSPAVFLAALHLRGRGLIDNGICSVFHNSGRRRLPDGDPVGELIRRGRFTQADVADAWGTRLRLKQGRSSLGCGLLSGKWTIVSAGPDRKFGTPDDLDLGSVRRAAAYYPNYSGCRFYQSPVAVRHLTRGAFRGEYLEGKSEFDLGARLRRNPAGPADSVRLLSVGVEKEARKAGGQAFGLPDKSGGGGGKDPDGAAPIRVREFFPETLLWNPALITDEKGVAILPVEMADSITTWRLTASASSRGGLLGSTTSQIVVFQDFFVDIDFPVALTQNDAVSVPIAVYNYLKEDQTVTLKLKAEDWFELIGEPKREVRLKSGQVKAVYFRLRVRKIGLQSLTVEARGGRGVGDAIKRTVEVVPDGKRFETVINDRLRSRIEKTIEIPENAIEDSFKIYCKCYPGVFSQVLEGIQGMLGMPHG